MSYRSSFILKLVEIKFLSFFKVFGHNACEYLWTPWLWVLLDTMLVSTFGHNACEYFWTPCLWVLLNKCRCVFCCSRKPQNCSIFRTRDYLQTIFTYVPLRHHYWFNILTSEQINESEGIIVKKCTILHIGILKGFIYDFKGTVNVSDPPCKGVRVRDLHRYPWKKNGRYIRRFSDSKSIYFCGFLHCFLLARNAQVTFAKKPRMKINS